MNKNGTFDCHFLDEYLTNGKVTKFPIYRSESVRISSFDILYFVEIRFEFYTAIEDYNNAGARKW